MEKKQSSIEWLENQLKERYSLMNSEPLFEEAKAMHKEEIESAIIYAEREHNILGNVWPTQTVLDKAQDYYNETFGGNNE